MVGKGKKRKAMAKECTSQTLIRMQLQTGVAEVHFLIVHTHTHKHKLTYTNNLFAKTECVIMYVAYLIFNHYAK